MSRFTICINHDFTIKIGTEQLRSHVGCSSVSVRVGVGWGWGGVGRVGRGRSCGGMGKELWWGGVGLGLVWGGGFW